MSTPTTSFAVDTTRNWVLVVKMKDGNILTFPVIGWWNVMDQVWAVALKNGQAITAKSLKMSADVEDVRVAYAHSSDWMTIIQLNHDYVEIYTGRGGDEDADGDDTGDGTN